MMDQTMIIILSVLAGLILGLIIGFLWSNQKNQIKILSFKDDIARLGNEKQQIESEIERERLEWEKRLLEEKSQFKEIFDKEKNQLLRELTAKEQELKYWNKKWEMEQAHFKEKEEKFKQEFENLAQKILDEKAEKFTRQNKESLDTILNPFTKAIKEFKSKVEETEKHSHGRHEALYEQLKQLKELNQQLSQEALNLTKALKGESKTQGIWGETILNNLLEKSGLEKGREYFTQQNFTVEKEGKQTRYQPDVVIQLPNNKKMIIDAKVSLTAYEKYVNAEDEQTAKAALKDHVRSIKQHIDGLQKKNYEDLLKGESPEFILMFIPIETAFSLALKEDPGLYNYAFKFNIVMVTPSTLLATLKIVDNMWTNERQTRNAVEIADQAGKLYDKFHGLLEDLRTVGIRLSSAQESYHNAIKKLQSGRGNLLGQVEKLKKLGAKAKKQLPPPDEE